MWYKETDWKQIPERWHDVMREIEEEMERIK